MFLWFYFIQLLTNTVVTYPGETKEGPRGPRGPPGEPGRPGKPQCPHTTIPCLKLFNYREGCEAFQK